MPTSNIYFIYVLCSLHRTLTDNTVYRLYIILTSIHKIVRRDLLCPLACLHGKTQLLLDEFLLNLIFEYFSQTCQENPSVTKI